jgi:CheY-like chemotaxis protein
MGGERARCTAAGMDDYIAKPVGLQVLREAMERFERSRETVVTAT